MVWIHQVPFASNENIRQCVHYRVRWRITKICRWRVSVAYFASLSCLIWTFSHISTSLTMGILVIALHNLHRKLCALWWHFEPCAFAVYNWWADYRLSVHCTCRELQMYVTVIVDRFENYNYAVIVSLYFPSAVRMPVPTCEAQWFACNDDGRRTTIHAFK